MTNLMATHCKIILRFLEDNKIVGEENAVNGKEICSYLRQNHSEYFSKDFDTRQLRTRIMFLKRGEVPNIDMTRTIGSSYKGYYLAKSNEDSLRYQRNLAKTYLITAIKAGVKKEYFYQILNDLENKNLVDCQGTLPVTPHTHEVAHIYSDDLLEK